MAIAGYKGYIASATVIVDQNYSVMPYVNSKSPGFQRGEVVRAKERGFGDEHAR